MDELIEKQKEVVAALQVRVLEESRSVVAIEAYSEALHRAIQDLSTLHG